MLVRLLCAFWLCLVFCCARAQEPFCISLSIENGLPSNKIYNLWQDKKGYTWLTSDEGLHRYDGFSYKPYRSAGQSFIAGASIQEDAQGRIWYETFDGWLFYTDGDSLKPLQQNRPGDFVPFYITNNKIYVVQIAGIDVYNAKTLQLIRTIPISTNRVQHTACNKNGFYITNANTLYHVGPDYRVSSYSLPVSNTNNLAMIATYSDSIAVVTGSTDKYSTLTFTPNLHPLHTYRCHVPGTIRTLSVLDGEPWLCTTRGLVALSSTANSKAATTDVYFSNKSILCAFRDRNKQYWIATEDGIQLVPELNNKMYNIAGEVITRIMPWRNQLVAGTRKGNILLFDKDKKTTSYVHRTDADHDIYYLNVVEDIVAYTGERFGINNFCPPGDEHTWPMAIKSVSKIDNKYLAIARSGACGLLPIPNREHLKSAWDRAFDNATDQKRTGTHDLIGQVRARAVYYSTSQQALFCGTNIGLLRFGADGSYQTITNGGQPFYAREIIEVSQSLFLLSARGRLCRLHKNALAELPDAAMGQNLRKIMAHGQQICLIAENDIFLFDPATNKNITVNVHVSAGSVNDLAWTNDTLWVATDAGLFNVPAPTRQPDVEMPPLYINSILVNGVGYTPRGNTSVLPHNTSHISINYSIIAPVSNTSIAAFYRMTDNGPWISLSKDSRTLNFQALAPGRYNIGFKVGNKLQTPHFAFVINAPYWQQWWFIVACTALLGIMAGAVYARHMRARLRKLEGQKEKIQLQEDRSRSMLAAIRAQMNPHFFFNALNTIQAYIVTNNKEKATNYLAKFSMLTRTILEMTETETVSLSVEINALQLYLDLEKMRFPSGFEYSINAQAISSPDSIEIPSMIIQPYVENAVKHGLLHKEGEKKLFIDMHEDGNTLIVTIDDNGIGRARSGELNKIKQQKHRSFSTRATEERLAILNSSRTENITVTIIDKQNDRKQPTGTTVIIKIPVENV